MELNATVLSTIVAALAICMAAYALIKAGKPATVAGVTAALEDATVSAKELAEVALTAAGAAEQLWRSGKIMRDERLDHAFDHVRNWFPDLDEDTIITALESAVFSINAIAAALPKNP